MQLSKETESKLNTEQHLGDLSDELKMYICLFLKPKEILQLSFTSRYWTSFCQEHTFWSKHLPDGEKKLIDKSQFQKLFLSNQFLREIEKTLALRYIAGNNPSGKLIPGIKLFDPKIAVIERDKELKQEQIYVKVQSVAPKIFTVTEIKMFAVKQAFVIGYNDADIFDEELDRFKPFYLESLLKHEVNAINQILLIERNHLQNLAVHVGKFWPTLFNPNAYIPQLIAVYETLVSNAYHKKDGNLLAPIQYSDLDHNSQIKLLPNNQILLKKESNSRKIFRDTILDFYAKGHIPKIKDIAKHQSIVSVSRLLESFKRYKDKKEDIAALLNDVLKEKQKNRSETLDSESKTSAQI